MESPDRHDLSYSVDDFEQFDENHQSSKVSKKNKLAEKSIDSSNYSFDFSTNNEENNPPTKEKSQVLNDKSYASEYSQEFGSPVYSQPDGGSQLLHQSSKNSKRGSELSSENQYQDDFLQEKSSVFIDTPSAKQIVTEKSVEYGEEAFKDEQNSVSKPTMETITIAPVVHATELSNSVNYGDEDFVEEVNSPVPAAAPAAVEIPVESNPITSVENQPLPAAAAENLNSSLDYANEDFADDFVDANPSTVLPAAVLEQSFDSPEPANERKHAEESHRSKNDDPADPVGDYGEEEFDAAESPKKLVVAMQEEQEAQAEDRAVLSPVAQLNQLIIEKNVDGEFFALPGGDDSSIESPTHHSEHHSHHRPQHEQQQQPSPHAEQNALTAHDEEDDLLADLEINQKSVHTTGTSHTNQTNHSSTSENEETKLINAIGGADDFEFFDQVHDAEEEAKETEALNQISDFVRRSSQAAVMKFSQPDVLAGLRENPELPTVTEDDGSVSKESPDKHHHQPQVVAEPSVEVEQKPVEPRDEIDELEAHLTAGGVDRVKRLSEDFMNNAFQQQSAATEEFKEFSSEKESLQDKQEEIEISQHLEQQREETIQQYNEYLSTQQTEATDKTPRRHSGAGQEHVPITATPQPERASEPIPADRDDEDANQKYNTIAAEVKREEEDEDDAPFFYPRDDPGDVLIYEAEDRPSTAPAVAPLRPVSSHKKPVGGSTQKPAASSNNNNRIKSAPVSSAANKKPKATDKLLASLEKYTGNTPSLAAQQQQNNNGTKKVTQLRSTVQQNRQQQQQREELQKQKLKEFILSKPNNPIRYHSQESCIVLTEICLHRRQFKQCPDYFCREAYAKFQWLKLMRKKVKTARELIESADLLWRKKLEHSLENALDALRKEQEEEIQLIAKKLSLKTINDKKLVKTVNFMKKHELDKNERMKVIYEDQELTTDHYAFLSRQLELRKDFNVHRKKAILDHLRFEHLTQANQLKKSVGVPMVYLEKMRGDLLTLIDFHHDRVEKSLIYILKLCVNPKLLHRQTFSLSAERLLQDRIFRSSLQAYDFLKVGLLTMSSICAKVREIYCNPDENIMKQYLMNYSNPMNQEIPDEDDYTDEFANEEDDGEEDRGNRKKKSSATRGRSGSSKRRSRSKSAQRQQDESNQQRQFLSTPKSRFTSQINQFRERSNSPARPRTAPDALPSHHGRPGKGPVNAMRDFSPKRNPRDSEDFQAIPLDQIDDQNRSYYSDFNKDEEGDPEEDFQHRRDSYNDNSFVEDDEDNNNRPASNSKKRSSTSRKKASRSNSEIEEVPSVIDEGSFIPDEISSRRNSSNKPPAQSQSIASTGQYSQDDFLDKSKSRSSAQYTPIDEEQDEQQHQQDQEGRPIKKKNKKKGASSHGSASSDGKMIITKKDLLVAQMKETKLNQSLLLQDILNENIHQKNAVALPSLSNSMASNKNTAQFITQFNQYHADNDSSPGGSHQEAYQSSVQSRKKIACSYCQKKVSILTAKSFPALLDENDNEVREKASKYIETNLHQDLEAKVVKVGRGEYSYLFNQLMKKLKYSVNKSSKRYSFVKTQSDGHLSGVISPTRSLSSSLLLEEAEEGEGAENEGLGEGHEEIDQQYSFELPDELTNTGGEVGHPIEEGPKKSAEPTMNNNKNKKKLTSLPPTKKSKENNKIYQQQKKFHTMVGQESKYHRASLHHDAKFCSYECMKRWTIFYCPVQMKYESEILIDMVAGYAVKI